MPFECPGLLCADPRRIGSTFSTTKKHLHIYDPDKGSQVKDMPFTTVLNDIGVVTYHLTIAPDARTLFLQSGMAHARLGR